MSRAERYAYTPVFTVESIPPGRNMHIGNGEFMTRCDKGCGRVYSSNTISDTQRHLWRVHDIDAPLLPPTNRKGHSNEPGTH